MRNLESHLIANREKRQLSALGYKQLNRIISKAAEIKGTHRYAKDFKPISDQITYLYNQLVFVHNLSKEQISLFQRMIKVTDNNLQLPPISSFIDTGICPYCGDKMLAINGMYTCECIFK